MLGKTFLHLTASAICISCASGAVAAQVDEETAVAAASGFVSRTSTGRRILPGRKVASAEARGSLWIVQLEPSGCVIVAGSDKCAPIVSFSADDFEDPDAGSPLDVLLRDSGAWVDKMESDGSVSTDAGWAKYTAPVVASSKLLSAAPSGTDGTGYDAFVAPFLGATWHQTAPYNDLAPYNYFCGCMATAAGQEIRYWRWPYRYEKFRQTTHGVRDAQNNYYNFTVRPNGLVPFDWDKVKANYRDESNASTPWAADKNATYNAAYLSFWMQSLTGMGYKPGGSGGTRQLAASAEDYWYEKGTVMTYWNDGYTNLWNAVKADLDWGSPIQINTAAHQMVIDGYAIENAGTDDEIDYINLNLGYGNATYWADLKTAVTSGTYSGVLAAFQTGYRPQKIVQFEPVPKVCASDVTLTWHMAPCYTNRTTGFTLEIAKEGGATTTQTNSTHDATTTYTATDLDTGGIYTFTVTPIMADGEGEGRANSVSTTIGTPEPAPEILSVSSVACGIELVQQDIFVECAMGSVNQIKVTCSESTTSLTNYSSHLTILPDEKISVAKEGNVFTVSVDATDMARRWDVEGEMVVLTLVAKNADETEAYKNLMLRFNSMRNVLGGTFDIVETAANGAVWFASGTTTTIDAKGQAVVFGANAVNGTGTLVLADSTGGGSFTFLGLDGFTGTLKWDSGMTVTLPSDMSGFAGTLYFDEYMSTYRLASSLPATAKVYIGGTTQLYIGNDATIDAAITGSGYIMVVGSASTFGNLDSFNGHISLGDWNNSGTVNISAGQEKNVVIDNGTVNLVLSRAQVAYGYSTSAITMQGWGEVVFKDESGNILKSWTEAETTTTYSIDSSANTWTPDELGVGNFYDAARWSQGLPGESDYVIFKDTFGDTEMTLNLDSKFNLGYVKVIGTKFKISGTSQTDQLEVATFENDIPTTLNTSQIVPSVVVPNEKLLVTAGITIDCDIDQSIANNIRDYSDLQGLYWEDCWHGTVVFSSYQAAGLNPNYWGNTKSSIRFNGVTGYFAGNAEFTYPVELKDNGTTPALNWNDGYSSTVEIFDILTGDGTFKTSGSKAAGEIAVLKDISGFTGAFDLARMTIAIADEKPTSNTGSNGRLHVCKAVTIPADKTWMANGGLYLGSGGALTVNGAFATGSGIVAYGEGAALTLEDGASVKVNAAISGDYAPTLDFKAGTYQITHDITETNSVNFCAASGKRTTLDANGHTMTLGPNYFSGSGDVHLTSSASGGAFVIQGVGASFTGTIYADISAGVTISGDFSQTSGKISISDIGLSVSSANLGNVIVCGGATLSVVLTDHQAMDSFSATGVTLSGGTIEFTDKRGKTIASSTTSTTYSRPADYTVPSAEPIAVWTGDFNTTFDGCSLDWHDNEFANGVIEIKDGYQGVDVNLASGAKAITVIVKYSDFSYSTSNGRVFFTSCADSTKTYDRTALRLTTGNAIRGSYNASTNSGTAESDHSNGTGVPPSSGYMVFTYGYDSVAKDTATMLYSGSAEGNLNTTNFWNSGLKFNADSNDIAIRGATIGGYRKQATANNWKNATGMKIESIAVFTRSLDADERDFYRFPKPPELTVLPATGSAVDWGSAVTAAYDDETATIWYKKYGEAEYTQYTAPLVLNASGLNFYYFHVEDANGNVIVEDRLFQYIVGNPPNATFTVEVPENTAIVVAGATDNGDGTYTAAIGAEVTVSYTATGAFVATGTTSQTITVAVDTETLGSPSDYSAVPAMAQIAGGAYYDTFANAVAAAADGDTVTLLANSSDVVALSDKTVVFAENGYSFSGTLSGNGTIRVNAAPSATTWNTNKFSTVSNSEWTGRFVVGWTLSGQMQIGRYGIAGSTIEVVNAISSGYFNKISDQTGTEALGAPSVAPKLYFDEDVTISDGFANQGQITTFAKVGMASGKTFNTRGRANGDQTYYAFTELEGFSGTLNVRGYDHVTIGTVILDEAPSFDSCVVKLIKGDNAALDALDGVRVKVGGAEAAAMPMEYKSVNGISGLYKKVAYTATAYPVPYSWFTEYGVSAANIELCATSTAANGKNTWWECYVLGLDPESETSDFKAWISLDGGVPVVAYSPTNETLVASGEIEYVLKGKPELTDEWQNVTFEDPGSTNRFFRVDATW